MEILKMKIICSILILYLISFVSNEFNVGDTKNTSYLFHKFENLNEAIFPANIKIKISLSRIFGTLLYSMDKHQNQLIVSLSDSFEQFMTIQFRKKEKMVSLSRLCGCIGCRYVVLEISIRITDKIYLQCNNGNVENYIYHMDKDYDEGYPLPYLKKSMSTSPLNEAQLWLVNTPVYEKANPNPSQLIGCIFDVHYNDVFVQFKKYSYITNECKRICNAKICNGGKCYETFNGKPICNCTTTFRNGVFCNDTMQSINSRTNSAVFEMNMLKLSWNTEENEIFKMQNSNVQLKISKSDKMLYFEYHYLNWYSMITTGLLSMNYVANSESILIAYFTETAINIHFFNSRVWINKIIPTNCDLRKEIFSNITFISGSGIIELVFKNNPKNYLWTKFNVMTFENIEKNINPISRENKLKEKALGCLALVTFILGMMAWYSITLIKSKIRIINCRLEWRSNEATSESNLNNTEESAVRNNIEESTGQTERNPLKIEIADLSEQIELK